ncbi:MAG: hypothetical protein JNJ90_08705 [Saprospiraceae bacterium]|nr:hypothetical protein [Saprospiraceae bacterium]
MLNIPTCRFLGLLLLTAACPALSAQTLLEITTDRHCNFSGTAIDEELYRFPEEAKADSLIRRIAAHGNSEINFEWVQTNVENAAAVFDNGKRYLLYSLDFLEKSSDLEKVAVLAHEIGHHVIGHTFDPANRQTEEIEADEFMGFILYLFGFPKAETEAFLTKSASASGIPPDLRRAAVDVGYVRGERTTEVSSNLPFDDKDMKSIEVGEAPQLPAFPWPPPACNTRTILPKTVFKNCKVLGDVEGRLGTALEAKGFTQRSFFSVPNGFAAVTQLEQYNGADGSVRNDRTRWLDYPAIGSFTGVLDYLKALVVPQKGYFRMFVFVVTDAPFGGSEKRVSKEQAAAWLNQGYNRLPNSLAAMKFTSAYDVTALVYEFEVPESNRKPVQKCPSPRFSAKTHLRKSGLAPALGF